MCRSTRPNGYRTEVDWATQMSYSGIYVHAAPWSVGSQGYSNVSHGCLNVSTSNARWFYDNTKRGDIVEVVNTVGSVAARHRRPRRLEHPVGAVEGRQRRHLTRDATTRAALHAREKLGAFDVGRTVTSCAALTARRAAHG